MTGSRLAAVGVLTGWGEGVAALPTDAVAAAGGRDVVAIHVPSRPDSRFRRVTRECVLGVMAVEAMLRDAGLEREQIAGERTAFVYVTAGAYGASNRAFIDAAAAGHALHFPYTAPSAVPAEVAIEFRFTGAYVILIGGPAVTVDALWQASTLLERGAADRAVVLSVETFEECADLYDRGRWLVHRPLVEAAACALLVAGSGGVTYRTVPAPGDAPALVYGRAGETFACGPLIELALADRTTERPTVSGVWRGRRATIAWNGSRVAQPIPA